MRNLNGLKWLCALVLIGAAANADVIIDNDTIPGSDIRSISISPTSGNIFINTTPGYTVTQKVSTPDGVVVNLSVSSSSINTGQSVTLSWTTANATNCSATGAWSGSKQTTGSQKVSLTNAGDYTFKLSCNNSTTQASDSVSVRVFDPSPTPTPTNCKTPSLPNTATPLEWESLWDVAFPLPIYAVRRMDVGRSGYNYVKFNTGNANGRGSFLLVATTTSPGRRRAALSECPGDFNVAAECKQTWVPSQYLRYSTNGAEGRCQLEKGVDYYFNVTFTDEQDTSISNCNTSVGKCLVEIRTGFTEQ